MATTLSNLAPPKTTAQLTQQATSEVNAENQAETAPLTSQIGSLQGRETNAIQQIGSMFDGLQPQVTQEANAVQSSYDAANQASQQIFQGAQQRMDQLANQRAQEAQALSQQMGGPVAVGEFMAGVQPDQTALAQLAPNALMHGLANAQAGEQQARTWSEQVFPAMRTEQQANARGYFEDQIKTINDQINSINSQTGAKVTQRLNDLQQQERTYALQVEQAKLDKLKADRDWAASKKTLANDTARLALARSQVTGTYQGKPTQSAIKQAADIKLASQKLTADEKLAAQKLGLSNLQYAEMVRHHMVTEQVQQQRANQSTQKKAMDILDSVTGHTKGTMTVTQQRELDPSQGRLQMFKNAKVYAVQGTKDAQHPDGKHYYIDETVHLTPTQQTRLYGSGYGANPQKLYDLLTGSNVPNAMALKLVRAKTGVGDFVPGKPMNYSVADLKAIGDQSFNELRGIAIQRGWKPDPRAKKNPTKYGANTNMLTNYIMLHNPGN